MNLTRRSTAPQDIKKDRGQVRVRARERRRWQGRAGLAGARCQCGSATAGAAAAVCQIPDTAVSVRHCPELLGRIQKPLLRQPPRFLQIFLSWEIVTS